MKTSAKQAPTAQKKSKSEPRPKYLTTVLQVIQVIGEDVLQDHFGANRHHLYHWKNRRGKFPPTLHAAMTEYLKHHGGYSADPVLWQQESAE